MLLHVSILRSSSGGTSTYSPALKATHTQTQDTLPHHW